MKCISTQRFKGSVYNSLTGSIVFPIHWPRCAPCGAEPTVPQMYCAPSLVIWDKSFWNSPLTVGLSRTRRTKPTLGLKCSAYMTRRLVGETGRHGLRERKRKRECFIVYSPHSFLSCRLDYASVLHFPITTLKRGVWLVVTRREGSCHWWTEFSEGVVTVYQVWREREEGSEENGKT